MVSAQNGEAAELRNDLDLGIKGVYCPNSPEKPHLISGPISPGSSAEVPAVPDWCQTIALHLETGGSWQFAVKASPGSAKKITFSMEAPYLYSKEKSPSMLMEQENGSIFASAAGGLFGGLRQHLIHGMDPKDWFAFAFVLPEAEENDGKFVVSLAGESWSLADSGVKFSDAAEGPETAHSITLEAPFSNPIVLAIFTELRNQGLFPRLLQHLGDNDLVLSEVQFSPDPWAKEGKEWQDLQDQLAKVTEAGSGRVVISFDTEEDAIDLTLDLDSGKAKLQMHRNPEAALG